MKRVERVVPALIAIWGIALLCLALLDWTSYESFWLSFAWR